MKTTFINCSKEGRKELRERGRKALEGRANDFEFFQSIDGKDYEELAPANGTVTAEMERINEIGDFYNYGLSIDYQEPEGRKRGYFRYQLSWGGPSEEIRFYFSGDGSRGQADKIEFVFLDWFVGVGFDVTNEDWAQWLWDWFQGCGTVTAEMEKALEY
jgi:hypothetical protein